MYKILEWRNTNKTSLKCMPKLDEFYFSDSIHRNGFNNKIQKSIHIKNNLRKTHALIVNPDLGFYKKQSDIHICKHSDIIFDMCKYLISRMNIKFEKDYTCVINNKLFHYTKNICKPIYSKEISEAFTKYVIASDTDEGYKLLIINNDLTDMTIESSKKKIIEGVVGKCYHKTEDMIFIDILNPDTIYYLKHINNIKDIDFTDVVCDFEEKFKNAKINVNIINYYLELLTQSNNCNMEYFRVNTTLDSVRAFLSEGYCILGGFECPSDIYSNSCKKTGVISTPTKKMIGGHYVIFVGYNDNTKLLKFKNSWGINWGVEGYGFLPFEYVNLGLVRDLWTIINHI